MRKTKRPKKKAYKNITVYRFEKDEDGNPFQKMLTNEHRTCHTSMWFIDGENEPSIELDGCFPLSTLKEIVEAMERFDSKARENL